MHLFETQESRVQCPYCFEWVDLELDPETRGELIHDCDVCCRPWRVVVHWNEDGNPSISVDRAQ